jgi:hypothetical protein
VISGPVGNATKDGPDMSVQVPEIFTDSQTAQGIPWSGHQAGLFDSEFVYPASGYQVDAGGATELQTGEWDWRNMGGDTPSSVTSGVNDQLRQQEDRHTFIAGIAFGVTGAALAAAAVEGVEAVREWRNGLRRSRPRLSSHWRRRRAVGGPGVEGGAR